MIRKDKYPCPYWKACMDYRRSKDICHNNDFTYCNTFKRLNKKEDERKM